MWSELTWFMWSGFLLKWSEVSYGDVLADKVVVYIRVNLYLGYWFYCYYFICAYLALCFNLYWGGFILFCNVYVLCGRMCLCMGFVMWGSVCVCVSVCICVCVCVWCVRGFVCVCMCVCVRFVMCGCFGNRSTARWLRFSYYDWGFSYTDWCFSVLLPQL